MKAVCSFETSVNTYPKTSKEFESSSMSFRETSDLADFFLNSSCSFLYVNLKQVYYTKSLIVCSYVPFNLNRLNQFKEKINLKRTAIFKARCKSYLPFFVVIKFQVLCCKPFGSNIQKIFLYTGYRCLVFKNIRKNRPGLHVPIRKVLNERTNIALFFF